MTTTPTAPTFLTWQPDASQPSGLRLVHENLIQCPLCGDWCGHLYEQTGGCLSCELARDEAEAHEQAAQGAESTCVCGID